MAVGLEGYMVKDWAHTLYDGSIYWDASGVECNHTTVYVSRLYEKNVTSGAETSYYFAGSQRVAMRQGSNLLYFAADHLGSTSLTLDENGTKIGEMKYYEVPRSAAEWASLWRDADWLSHR